MTNADVTSVINKAREKGLEVSPYRAKIYLRCAEILASDSQNENARKVVENFHIWLATGKEVHSFAEFIFGLPLTDEEKAAEARQ